MDEVTGTQSTQAGPVASSSAPAPAPAAPPVPETTEAGPAPPPDANRQNPPDNIAAIEQAAAAELARVYRAMPGVVAELIGGPTIADVQATFAAAQRVYADIRAAVLRDLGAALPPGHAAPGAPPAPADPFGLIAAGLRK